MMNIFLDTFKAISIVAISTGALATAANAASPGERFRETQQLVHAGKPDAALAILDELRQQYPNDVDYSFARAQALASMGRDREAIAELRIASSLAPDYEDVWRLHYAILAAQTDKHDRTALEELRQAAAERFPLATWWQAPKDTGQWTILVGTVYDDLSNGLPSWNNQFLEITHTDQDRNQYGLRLGRDQRFKTTNYSLGLRAEHRSQSGWFAGAGIYKADEPVILPDLSYDMHLGIALDEGWVAQVGYRRRDYQAVTVSSLTGTVEKYYGEFRFAYALTRSHLHGVTSFFNHNLTTNWFYSDRASISATLSSGREAESLGNGQVLESTVRGLSIGGRYRVGERYGLQWWIGIHKQGDLYRRRFLGMAVSIGI